MRQSYFSTIIIGFIFLVLCPFKTIKGQEKGLMIDRIEDLECNVDGIDSIISYMHADGYNTAYLYVSKFWFENFPALNDTLINKLKQAGISPHAVVSPSSYEPMSLLLYKDLLVGYDGIFIEFEFWDNGDDFREFKRFCKQLKSYLPDKIITHYIGWPGKHFAEGVKRLRFMGEISNRIAVHMYRHEVDLDFVRNRIKAIDVAGYEEESPFEIFVLYSTEPAFMANKLKEATTDEIHSKVTQEIYNNINFLSGRISGQIWFKSSDLIEY
ncbi:hypothetical protein [Luteibaculum oceani]|uniref:FHA domain-containing protein n=1 Tax=Luteibaculum oceani TaxID=1294296 RepID=A0A5C6VBR8_9FLAO|nr:hypothetical protein [Luteibaculum oceani]TXC82151.1 hypothetical protein FRX97_03390 [Luteibaculum oceani]